MARKQGKPSAEKTMQALVDAVVRLLDRGDARKLTCRGIAREAGVNHGLVHHYFGSKDDLIRAAARKTSHDMHEAHPPGVRVGWSFDYLRKNPALARVAARLCLMGQRDVLAHARPPEEIMERRLAAIRKGLAARGVEGVVDPLLISAVVAAALIGWVALRPLIDAWFDLGEEADDQLALLLSLVDARARALEEEDAG